MVFVAAVVVVEEGNWWLCLVDWGKRLDKEQRERERFLLFGFFFFLIFSNVIIIIVASKWSIV